MFARKLYTKTATRIYLYINKEIELSVFIKQIIKIISESCIKVIVSCDTDEKYQPEDKKN